MRFGVLAFGPRVAPRCRVADGVVTVTMEHDRMIEKRRLSLERGGWDDLLTTLREWRIDMVVCGGIARDEKRLLGEQGIAVVENVACATDEAVTAIVTGSLRPGLGFGTGDCGGVGDTSESSNGRDRDSDGAAFREFDCLACRSRMCQRGESCHPDVAVLSSGYRNRDELMLEAASDIALEDERVLCRLSELIYYCLEMKCRRIGIAYCDELTDATRILTAVLRRFFEVVPVCCKVGGITLDDAVGEDRSAPGTGRRAVTCNPLAQAKVLERAGCDIAVLVGLCLGVDCVFTGATTLPVTTLFVKDRSLANNPIGALYSDYYLKEAIQSASERSEPAVATGGASKDHTPDNGRTLK